MVVRYCDRCRAVIVDVEKSYLARIVNRNVSGQEMGSTGIEICAHCKDDLEKWLRPIPQKREAA